MPEYLITVPINAEEFRDLLGSMSPQDRAELWCWSARQINALEDMSRIISGVL
jgi:hypothetical protein